MKFILNILILFMSQLSESTPIKTVSYFEDNILKINTALGIATIIQLPETIQSMIIGDQSGFKVEYLNNAVTIKPLRWGANTNLYLITDKQRYNLRLQTERQEKADYVVYVKIKKPEESIIWRDWNKKIQVKDWTFEVLKIGKSKGGFTLIQGRVWCKNCFSLKPENFWIFQDGKSKIINGLYLSDLKFSKHQIEYGISLAHSDFETKKPILLQVKLDVNLAIEIPSEVLWK